MQHFEHKLSKRITLSGRQVGKLRRVEANQIGSEAGKLANLRRAKGSRLAASNSCALSKGSKSCEKTRRSFRSETMRSAIETHAQAGPPTEHQFVMI